MHLISSLLHIIHFEAYQSSCSVCNFLFYQKYPDPPPLQKLSPHNTIFLQNQNFLIHPNKFFTQKFLTPPPPPPLLVMSDKM